MEESNYRAIADESPASQDVPADRSWIPTTIYSLLAILGLILAYQNVDRIFSLVFMFGLPPSYPDYPGWQNVQRRVERQGEVRYTITTFETTDDSEQVAEFYNAYLARDERWYPRYNADYSNPIEWFYEDYCPATEVHVQRTALPTGRTAVEVRVIEESCFSNRRVN